MDEIVNELWGLDTPVPEGEDILIGVVGKCLENEFWQMVKEGVEEENDRLKEAGFDHITVVYDAPMEETDTEGQLSIAQNMINQGYDGLVICPIDNSNMTPAIEQAIEAGIPTLPWGTFFDEDPYVPFYIGDSGYCEGQMAGEAMAEMLNGKTGKVAVIMGIASNATAIGRTNGFIDYFEDNPDLGVEVIEPQNGNWDRNEAKDISDVLIRQHDDLLGIYCNNDTMAMGSLEAVKDAGKLGDVLVAGTDAADEAIQSIIDGELSITIGNFPYFFGKQCLQVLFHMMNGEEVPTRIQSIIATLTIENATMEQDATLELMNYGWLNYVTPAEYNAAHAE